jgi:hypothetical protein
MSGSSEGNQDPQTPDAVVPRASFDLTAQRPAAEQKGEGLPAPSIDVREPARRKIAYSLLALLAVIVLAAIVALFFSDAFVPLQRAKDIIGLLLTPVVGLVGSVVGFYFGAQTAQETRDSNPPATSGPAAR